MNKTERRHELQQNDLAAYLEQANKRIEPYSKQILVGILLVLAVVVAYSFYNSELEADSSMATMELIQNTNVPSRDSVVLGEINGRYIETSAGKLAKLYEGLALISDGSQNIYNDENRDEAKTNLTDAIALLEPVAQNTTDTLIESRAYLGIGLANSILGKNTEAAEAYRKVVNANESEAMVENANSRIAYLESDSGKNFADWFETADFTPLVRSNPDPSLPPNSGLDGLPSLNFGLPNMEPTEPSSGKDGEANPLKGDATPRDLDGGLNLPADAGKAPAAGTDKAPATGTDKAPATGTDEAPATGTDEAPATGTDEAPATGTDEAPAAGTDKGAESASADNSATDK